MFCIALFCLRWILFSIPGWFWIYDPPASAYPMQNLLLYPYLQITIILIIPSNNTHYNIFILCVCRISEHSIMFGSLRTICHYFEERVFDRPLTEGVRRTLPSCKQSGLIFFTWKLSIMLIIFPISQTFKGIGDIFIFTIVST